jgi:hypothetical protein
MRSKTDEKKKKKKKKKEIIIYLYTFLNNYPKFLAINKVWIAENSVDILVNTEIKSYYLIHLEPGNYGYTFGQQYGFGDLAYRQLTGTCLNPYLLDLFKLKNPGYLRYMTRPKTWSTFGYATETQCALWLDRGSYHPSIVI